MIDCMKEDEKQWNFHTYSSLHLPDASFVVVVCYEFSTCELVCVYNGNKNRGSKPLSLEACWPNDIPSQ